MDKVVCYYGSWAAFRPGKGACKVKHLAPELCTHLIYAFIGFDDNGYVKYGDTESQLLPQIIRLKRDNSQLKVLVSIGGWEQGSIRFSNVVGNEAKRANFVESTIEFLDRFYLDGVDLDWEYPGLRGGSPRDKANFATLLRQFRHDPEFKSNKYLLTAAVGASNDKIETSYDVSALNKYLDFVNVMTYDYNGPWEGCDNTGHNAPIKSVISSINNWVDAGLQKSKFILGVPAYGRVFKLAKAHHYSVGSKFLGKGNPGPYTSEAGSIGYNEVCKYIESDDWETEYDDDAHAPYMYKGDQWISYDNPRSIRHKVKQAKKRHLGGIMLWSAETDDFRGVSGKRHPIQKAINDAMESEMKMLRVFPIRISVARLVENPLDS